VILLRGDTPENKQLSQFVSRVLNSLEADFDFSFPFISKIANVAFRPDELAADSPTLDALACEYSNLQGLHPGHFKVIVFRPAHTPSRAWLFLPSFYRRKWTPQRQLLALHAGPDGNHPKAVALFRRYFENLAQFERSAHIGANDPDLPALAGEWLAETFYGGLGFLESAFNTSMNRLWLHNPGVADDLLNRSALSAHASYWPLLRPLLALYFARTPEELLSRLPGLPESQRATLGSARHALLRVAVRDRTLLRTVQHVYKMLFRAAFAMNDPGRESLFASLLPHNTSPARRPVREIKHADYILESFKSRYPRAAPPAYVWCVPWMQASTLVRSRHVLLIRGIAHITYMDAYTAFFHDAIGVAVERAAPVDYATNFKPVVDAHCRRRGRPPTAAIPHPRDIQQYKDRMITYDQAKKRAALIAQEYWEGLPLNPVTDYGYGHYLIDNTARDWYHSALRADIARAIEQDKLARSVSGLAASRFSSEQLRQIFASAFARFCAQVDPAGKWKVRPDAQKRGVLVLDRGAPSRCVLCSERLQREHVHEVDNTAFLTLNRAGTAVEWGCWRVGHAQRRLVMPVGNH